MYSEPKEAQMLREKLVDNRRAAEQRLVDTTTAKFSCAATGKSSKTERKMEKIRIEEEQKLQFDSYRAKPMPKEVMVG